MLELKMTKREINIKRGKYLYEVWENDKIIATHVNSNDYVACYVTRKEVEINDRYYGKTTRVVYKLPIFTTRVELLGRIAGPRRQEIRNIVPYAIAILNDKTTN
jgi:hypothetical protein